MALHVALAEELLEEKARPATVQVPPLGRVRDITAVQNQRGRLRLVHPSNKIKKIPVGSRYSILCRVNCRTVKIKGELKETQVVLKATLLCHE